METESKRMSSGNEYNVYETSILSHISSWWLECPRMKAQIDRISRFREQIRRGSCYKKKQGRDKLLDFRFDVERRAERGSRQRTRSKGRRRREDEGNWDWRPLIGRLIRCLLASPLSLLLSSSSTFRILLQSPLLPVSLSHLPDCRCSSLNAFDENLFSPTSLLGSLGCSSLLLPLSLSLSLFLIVSFFVRFFAVSFVSHRMRSDCESGEKPIYRPLRIEEVSRLNWRG